MNFMVIAIALFLINGIIHQLIGELVFAGTLYITGAILFLVLTIQERSFLKEGDSKWVDVACVDVKEIFQVLMI